MLRTDIRLALPSKGALHKDAFDFLEACGLKIFRPNPRQYEATIPSLPQLTVMSHDQLRQSLTGAGFDIIHDWQPSKGAAVFIIARKPA